MRRYGIRAIEGQGVVEFALVLPLMLVLLVAIFDLGRIYTTMLAVESAAREAADWGAYSASRWDTPVQTELDMQARACTASSNLPEYAGGGGTCTNPHFSYTLLMNGSPATPEDCRNGWNEPPCSVVVTLRYDFRVLVPLGIDFGGVRYGLPETLTFERTSIFAVSNLGAPTPSPMP